jgi:hypothetical protein
MHLLIANVPPASRSFANVVDTAVMFAAGPVAVPLPVAVAAAFKSFQPQRLSRLQLPFTLAAFVSCTLVLPLTDDDVDATVERVAFIMPLLCATVLTSPLAFVPVTSSVAFE